MTRNFRRTLVIFHSQTHRSICLTTHDPSNLSISRNFPSRNFQKPKIRLIKELPMCHSRTTKIDRLINAFITFFYMLQPTLILPTKDEVKKMISEGQPLGSNGTLVAGSRTFAKPISQLPGIMARAVREMYADLRALDEIEDGDIEPDKKKLGLHKIAFLGSELANPELTEIGLESLISKELPEITQILLSGADPFKVPFINSFGTGLVLRDAYRLPLEVRKIIGNSIVHMSTGMMRALGDGGIKTEKDLK